MVAKTGIIDELGEAGLLRPARLNAALAANDRIKYRFSLLQAARARADSPASAFGDLRAEREAAALAEPDLDAVVAAARRDGGAYVIPQAGRIHEAIADDVRAMFAPLAEGDAADGFAVRIEQLLAGPRPDGDRVTAGYVGEITHARRERGDSLHLLVMDMHKALNALQASLARESVDGAQVYALEERDRVLVRAFMAGLNATAPLKFDHPGLGTTATSSAGTLVIQNDIGTTDAHVLVVHVRERSCVITYTDVHPRRAGFFKSLFEDSGVSWEDDRTRRAERLVESDSYYLCTGRFDAPDDDALRSHLRFLGSRIVFLIDWNKARKRMRPFMRTRDAIAVLKWAADHDLGHRAFLELGGDRFIYDALESAGTGTVRYGERLDRVLGRETMVEHLKFTLRTTATGLLEGRSMRLVRDEIKADLVERLQTAEQDFYGLLVDHAALTVDLAGQMRDALLAAQAGASREELEAFARRAKLWETRADDLVVRVREGMRHAAERDFFSRLAHEMDDVADHLEDATCVTPLLPVVATAPAQMPVLTDLAELALQSARRLASALESARLVQRGGAREDLHDFLEAVDRMVTLEHATDSAERDLTLALVTQDADHRQLHLLSHIGKRLEKAADSVARSALMLRDRVMSQVIPR